MAPGGSYTTTATDYSGYYIAVCASDYRTPTKEEMKALKALQNRINFLKFYTRFKLVVDCKRIVFVVVRAFEKRITRQHKTRQVKNL